jgi:molybdopterin-guanine dinucleotide biosynthesis protein A
MLAVDMPFVSSELLKYLVARARGSSAVVTVARVGGWQPLCAVYRREFAEYAERALHEGRYKIDLLFEAAPINVISEEELVTAGFSANEFRNLNTREDVESAAVGTPFEAS